MGEKIINLSSLKRTDDIARLIAAHLFPGSIILLWGDMGSGKTTFTKSLCAGLGVRPEIVTSPTYTLVNIYPGHLPIFHVDLFRLSSPQELDDFDKQDLVSEEGITIVEWPKFLINFLFDEPVLNLKFHTISEQKRLLNLECQSCDFDTLLKTLEQPN